MQLELGRTAFGALATALSAVIVIGLAGFLASDASPNLDRVLAVAGIAIFLLLCLGTGWFAGQHSGPVLGVSVGVAALVIAVYGNYAAYAFGWHGLEPHDLGSDDASGHTWVLLVLGVSFIPIGVVGGILAFLGSLMPGHRA
jgi:hypothetical protein